MHDKAINTIIEPDAIVFSFDAIGWSILFYLLIASAVAFIIWRFVVYRKNKYRRQALVLLNSISDNSNTSTQTKAVQLNTLIKQICLLKYDRREVANLEGEKWRTFLNAKVKKPCYTMQEFKKLQSGLFNASELDAHCIEEFIQQSKIWITKHAV